MGLAVGASAAFIVANTPQAHASVSTDTIAAVGSDTIDQFTQQYFATSAVTNIDPNVINVPTPVDMGHFGVGPALDVPADTHCNDVKYTDGTIPNDATHQIAPNGSGAGKTALTGAVAGTYPNSTATNSGALTGCVDIGRSSSARGGTDPATFQYYAFALDGVTWASPSLNAPASLTVQQLRDIYNCVDTDWSQVGGSPGPIQRYMPQTGSGTRSFFISNVLNGVDPDTVNTCSPNKDTMEENTGTDLYTANPQDPTGTNAATYQDAIVPYSAGKFVFQATNSTNPTLDVRGGVRPGGIVPTTPSAPAVYGVRWTGSAWLLNNATIVGGRTVNDLQTFGTLVLPDNRIDSATANFTSADVGETVAGTNVPPGAVITTINSTTEALISIPDHVSATGGTLTIGPAVISEKNPNISTATDTSVFPGVRYVFYVLDAPPASSPSFSVAQQIVGFADSVGGVKSPLCSGAAASLIRANGFLDLPALNSPGGNTAVTCRLK
jgi:ABC-type phosphate transport system substrate-binding protein